MSAFLYTIALQWKLDIRSRSMLITCYVVPLLFFAIMGGIFTSVNPTAEKTLVQSMTIMGVSMGSMIGLPPTLNEVYASDIKKMYQANGVPLYLGLISIFLSAFIHLIIMSTIILFIAPIAFKASVPDNLPSYFGGLTAFIAASLSVGCVLGLVLKGQAKLTMLSQIVFLPSIMLSGIMFPAQMLPQFLEAIGMAFPATWGFRLLTEGSFSLENFWPLALVFILCSVLCFAALKSKSRT